MFYFLSSCAPSMYELEGNISWRNGSNKLLVFFECLSNSLRIELIIDPLCTTENPQGIRKFPTAPVSRIERKYG